MDGGEASELHAQAARVAETFRERAGRAPEGIWAAPGRVNLIGDHTDYNDGFVFPFAIDRHVVAAAGRRDDDRVRAWSLQEPAGADVALGDVGPGRPGGWAAYVAGVAWSLARAGVDVGGVDLVLDGAVPRGSGLSSSAAIECVTALAIAEVHGARLTRQELALAAQRAEVEIAGVPCGVMDQMASIGCRAGRAMLLDTRSLEADHVPLETDVFALLVIDVGAPHRLVEGEYARRRAECQAAASALGVASLRDATPDDLRRLTDRTLGRRARHVVSENRRVVEAAERLRARDLDAVGLLLTASHASLRDDFEVSTPELDATVDVCLSEGAVGARLTGAGFGGCVLALTPRDAVDRIAAAVHRRVPTVHQRGAVSEVVPGDGARRVA